MKKQIASIISKLVYFSKIVNMIMLYNNYKKRIRILMYHRISDSYIDIFPDYSNLAISVKNFEEQMKFVKKNYNVINLEDLKMYFSGTKKLPENPLIITFDDGFKDNYTNAYPILKKYKLSATIFLSIDSIEGGELNWLNSFYYIMNNVKYKDFVEEFNKLIKSNNSKNSKNKEIIIYKINDNKQTKIENYEKIESLLKSMKNIEKNKIINNLVKKFKLRLPKAKDYYLSWEQIKKMMKNNIIFGSHTCSHSNLSKLNDNELKKEIYNSKYKIEKRTNKRVLTFSYPWGNKKSYNKKTISFLKQYGYIYAATTKPGFVDKNSNLLELNRITVPNVDIYTFSLKIELGL